MNRVNPQLRHLARRLVAFEARDEKSSTVEALFSVPEKLRQQLATLMGEGGFRALLARALALASAEVPWLRGVQVMADGSVEGTAELQAQFAPDKLHEGRVVVLAELLGLLVAFIGENLTLRLVHEIWPKVPLQGLDLENGGKYEKTK